MTETTDSPMPHELDCHRVDIDNLRSTIFPPAGAKVAMIRAHQPIRCCYRPFSSYWWRHWLTPRTYTLQLRTMWQRAMYGMADYDAWGLCSYVPNVIANGCTWLADNTCGTPMMLEDDEWVAILRKIAHGFTFVEERHEPHRDRATGEWSEPEPFPDPEAFDLFRKWLPCMWD